MDCELEAVLALEAIPWSAVPLAGGFVLYEARGSDDQPVIAVVQSAIGPVCGVSAFVFVDGRHKDVRKETGPPRVAVWRSV